MAPHAIVSYDDTENDHDALMLGRILGEAGAQLTLAYVRHTTETQRTREELDFLGHVGVRHAPQIAEQGARAAVELVVEAFDSGLVEDAFAA